MTAARKIAGAPSRLAQTLACLSAAAALTGCGGSSHPRAHEAAPSATVSPAAPTPVRDQPAPSMSGLPDLSTVDGNDPTAVSRAALTVMWTTDSSLDHGGQHDAQLRAVPYLTPAYAVQIRAAQPSPPPPDAWVRDRVRTHVQMRPGEEERPADTPTTAYRQWLLTVTSIDAHGHRPVKPVHVTAYVILNRTAGQPWRVSQVSTY